VSIIYDETADAYHANPAVGSSLGKLARKSLRLFNDVRSGLAPREDKPSFQVGRLIHMRVLEPDRYAEQVVTCGPINPRTGQPYGRDTKAFADWQAENPGKVVVEQWIDVLCERMPEWVREILKDGKPETTIRAPYSDTLTIQCRPDWMRGSDDWDLKTMARDIDAWQWEVKAREYWFSAGWYKMVKQADGSFPAVGSWRWIFCEKQWPFRWKLVRMSTEYLERSMEIAEETAAKISEAMESDEWEDPDDSIEEVAEIPADLTDNEFTVSETGGISI
jgi:hypothetical protein